MVDNRVMTADPRELIVMRHAKTESGGADDRSRRLTERGIRDARRAGEWLAGQGRVPDVVLVSPAVRAQQTVDQCAHASWPSEVHTVDLLYTAGVDDVIELLGDLSGEPGAVMIVGHNPTMADVVWALQDEPPDDPDRLPTAGVVVLEIDGSWADLARGAARAVARTVGRG